MNIPSVTFSFNFGSVGFPFVEGMVSSVLSHTINNFIVGIFIEAQLKL
jgi:hypothetical protein